MEINILHCLFSRRDKLLGNVCELCFELVYSQQGLCHFCCVFVGADSEGGGLHSEHTDTTFYYFFHRHHTTEIVHGRLGAQSANFLHLLSDVLVLYYALDDVEG